jgi:hypothetical protein
MSKNRLEAFSDEIIAFAITLLILEIHIPDLCGWRIHKITLFAAEFYRMAPLNPGKRGRVGVQSVREAGETSTVEEAGPGRAQGDARHANEAVLFNNGWKTETGRVR